MTRHRPSTISATRTVFYIVLLALVVTCMWLLGRCSHAPGGFGMYTAKSGGDTLDIAIEISPLKYSLAGDSISGLDYEIVCEMARAHGRPVKFHPFAPLSHALQRLADGTVDVVIAGLPATSEMKEAYNLTDAVYVDRSVLVQLRDADGKTAITSSEQLAGDSVWIPDHSSIRSRIVNFMHELGDTIYVKTIDRANSEQLVLLTATGQIPRAVVNAGVARRLASHYPDLDVSTPVSFNQFQSWVTARTDSALCDTLNTWLTQFKATPRYRELVDKYMNR